MRAGALKTVVAFQSLAEGQDARSNPTGDWTTFLTTRGEFTPMTGTDAEERGRVDAVNRATLTVRRDSATLAIEPAHTALIDGVRWNIRGEPVDPDRRRDRLVMSLEGGVAV